MQQPDFSRTKILRIVQITSLAEFGAGGPAFAVELGATLDDNAFVLIEGHPKSKK
jgi:hypothetical protein